MLCAIAPWPSLSPRIISTMTTMILRATFTLICVQRPALLQVLPLRPCLLLRHLRQLSWSPSTPNVKLPQTGQQLIGEFLKMRWLPRRRRPVHSMQSWRLNARSWSSTRLRQRLTWPVMCLQWRGKQAGEGCGECLPSFNLLLIL